MPYGKHCIFFIGVKEGTSKWLITLFSVFELFSYFISVFLFRYTVTISATALDNKSALATYVCLPSQLPCTVLSSTHYDARGIAVNTVTISTEKADLSELHLIVVGWGDADELNTFTLGATLLTIS